MRVPFVRELTLFSLFLAPIAAQARPDDDDPRGRGSDAHERQRPEAIRNASTEHVSRPPSDFDRSASRPGSQENPAKSIGERPQLRSDVMLKANPGDDRPDDPGAEHKTTGAQHSGMISRSGAAPVPEALHAKGQKAVLPQIGGARDVAKAGHGGDVTTVRQAARLSERAKAALRADVPIVDRIADSSDVGDKTE
jgi:hypothetical protein